MPAASNAARVRAIWSRFRSEGGTPTLITTLPGPFRRAAWSADGQTIVYGASPIGLFTVAARGGAPTQIVEHRHIEHPSFLDLPDGRLAYLYQTAEPRGVPPLPHAIYIQVVGEKEPRLVANTSSTNPYPAYSPSGHIVYVDGNGDSSAVWALPFSLARLQATGSAFPIAQHGASPMVSRTGTLVYGDVPSNRWQAKWVNRSGGTISSIGDAARQDGLSLSPDGRTLAVQGGEGSKGLWVYDLNSGIKSRVGVESVVAPQIAWTPSGSEITFAANRAGSLDIFSKSVGSDEEPTLLVGTPMNEFAPDWSPGQKILIYTAGSPGINRQLLYRERRENGSLGEAAVFLKTSFNESMPRFSPDGHFVAYVSDESGSNEVYVREFPTGANKRRISPNGGTLPRWSRTGKEIYYMGERRLFAAGVTMSPEHSSVPAMPLFERRSLSAAFDVSGDGKQFVIMDRPAGEPPLSIHVVHNWYSEFRGQHSEPAK